jgi:hypothetical protein
LSAMDAIFLAILAIVVLGIIVVLIYLLDKVNRLEGASALSAISEVVTGAPAGAADNGLNGLTGKALWDAVCGKGAGANLDADGLASLRKRYQPILHKHILAVVENGAKDAQAGTSTNPTPDLEIATLRAKVESWLPPQHVKAIYTAGYEAASNPEDIPRLAQSLDETCATLYARAEIDLPPTPYSGLVFGATPAPAEGTEGATDDSGMADASDSDTAADGDFDIKPVKRN